MEEVMEKDQLVAELKVQHEEERARILKEARRAKEEFYERTRKREKDSAAAQQTELRQRKAQLKDDLMLARQEETSKVVADSELVHYRSLYLVSST